MCLFLRLLVNVLVLGIVVAIIVSKEVQVILECLEQILG